MYAALLSLAGPMHLGGRKIATVYGADTTRDELADMMVGHAVAA